MKKKLLFYLSIVFLIFPVCYSKSEEFKLPKDFKQFTSYNLQGYLKPLFTSVEQGFNSNIYTRANYGNKWSFAIDVSAMGMIIPDVQKSYDAELPEFFGNYDYIEIAEYRNGEIRKNFGTKTNQPTIYGGTSTATFAAAKYHYTSHTYEDSKGNKYEIPDTIMAKTIAFVEGNNITFMSGLPNIQFILGLPIYSQMRLRFFYLPVPDFESFYIGLFYNQRIDKFFNLFKEDPSLGLAVNLGIHQLSIGNFTNVGSFSIGTHFSKTWESGFAFYAGLQYEDIYGKIKIEREELEPYEQIDSPYPEIRFGMPIDINIETFTNYRLTAGISYRWKIIELHADLSLASQPMISAGICFWIADFNVEEKKPERRREPR